MRGRLIWSHGTSILIWRRFYQVKTTIKATGSTTTSYVDVFRSLLQSPPDDKEHKKIHDGSRDHSNRKMDQQSISRLLKIARLETKTIGAAIATLGISTGISLLFPSAIGYVLDLSLHTNQSSLYGMSHEAMSAGLFGLFMVQSGLITIRSSLLNISAERLSAGIRRDLFKAILQQDIGYFDQQKTGDLMNRLSTDTTTLQRALTNNVSNGIRSIFMVIGGVGMVCHISPFLTGVSLILAPPLAYGGMKYGKFVQAKQRAIQNSLGRTMDTAQEVITNIRTVRSFTKEQQEAIRFDINVDDSYLRSRQIGVVGAIFDGAVHMASNFSFLAVLLFGGNHVAQGHLTPGDLTAFLMYSMYIGFNVANLSGVYTDLKRASGAASRIYDVIDHPVSMPLSSEKAVKFYEDSEGREPGAHDSSRSGGVLIDWRQINGEESNQLVKSSFNPHLIKISKENIKGNITFDNINFAYPSRKSKPILSKFSLDIQAGNHLSIVGPSGSGKSTIGSLLTRLYDVDEGKILIDGIDIKNIDPQNLRSMIAVVSQEATLFGLSIYENIVYGSQNSPEHVDYEEVIDAAKASNAHNFITSFPDGYDTLVGEKGLSLSGGQKQRIAIARALLKNAPIIILDEATSALDSESETYVNKAFQAMDNKTIITIAHRLSTIKMSKIIVVLSDHGYVEEVGSFDELYHVNENSKFRALMHRQAG